MGKLKVVRDKRCNTCGCKDRACILAKVSRRIARQWEGQDHTLSGDRHEPELRRPCEPLVPPPVYTPRRSVNQEPKVGYLCCWLLLLHGCVCLTM